MLHKFVDDSTQTEIIERVEPSAMSDHLNNVIEWSRDNLMNVNYKDKTNVIRRSEWQRNRSITS